MKRLLSLLSLSLLIAAGATAGRVTSREALATARQFMPGKQMKEASASRSATSGSQNYYVFNADADEGFIIVSADDRTPDILGYSDHGNIDPRQLPCNVEWLLSYYDEAIAALGDSHAPAASRADSRGAISPMLTTQWGQGDPYNVHCPVYQGTRCVTGCVATAMAQVINHQRWPEEPTSSVDAYTTDTYGISMPGLAPRQFDWNNMSPASIADLMLYCGQSVRMDYGPDTSGAGSWAVIDALKNVFGFSKSAYIADRAAYSDDNWNELIYRELQKGCPVMYFGDAPADGGHAFVVDGYTDGLYHINWGWEGYCDGFFSLDRLHPGTLNGDDYSDDHSFRVNQQIIVNVSSEANTPAPDAPMISLSKFSCGNRYAMREDPDSYFTSSSESYVTLNCNYAGTYHLGIGLYKDDGLVKIISDRIDNLSPGAERIFALLLDIEPDIPQGEYKAKFIYMPYDSEEWIMADGADEKYLMLKITDTHLVIRQIPENYEDSNTIEYGVHTIAGITYRLYGQKSSGSIRYWADVIPFEETGYYAGDIYIPDYARYNDTKFEVKECRGFISCPALTSLSIPVLCWSSISNCPKLKKIEFREGVTACGEIVNCPELETVSYPSTCKWFYPPSNCEKLSSITVRNIYPVTMKACYYVNNLPSLTDIYLTGEFPPTIELPPSVIGEEINQDIKVHVLAGTMETYLRTDWAEWTLVEDGSGISVNVKLDYCGNDSNVPIGIGVHSKDCNAEISMKISASQLKAYRGCSVSAIEFFCNAITLNGCTFEEIYDGLYDYVFLTTPGKNYEIKQEIKAIPDSWMRIDFLQPYIISDKDIYVGVGKYESTGMGYANYDVIEKGIFQYRIMGDIQHPGAPVLGTWNSFEANGIDNQIHPFPIRMIVEGERLPNDIVIASVETVNTGVETNSRASVIPSSSSADIRNNTQDAEFFITDRIIPADTETKSEPVANTYGRASDAQKQIKLKIRNRSPRPVRNVTLDWEIDGKAQEPVEINTHLMTNHEDIVYVDVPSDVSGRVHTATFSVADIDGEPDEVPENSTPSTAFATFSNMTFPRRYVMEEATGTWCQWCPRGMATIEHMTTLYPDNFIPIAIHYGDMMEPADGTYDGFLSQVGSYPAALVNRQSWIDVNPFELGEERNLAEAMIKAGAEFTEAGEVEVTAETTFGFSENGNGDYRVAYVLLENNVGPDYQTNAYSNPDAADNPDDLMNWWTHQEQYVEMTFDHVARSIHDYNGVGGQLPSAFAEGEPLTTVYTLPLPENVQNAENLYVVTLLIDGLTGEILNADETDITGTPPAGIVEVKADAGAKFDVYSLSGIRVRSGVTTVEGLPAGIYIVNGRKVAVR